LQGELVGLITSMAAIQGGETPGGFAVPINAAMKRIIEVLKRGDEVDYGFLGVAFDERSPNDRAGIKLTHVGKGTPADLDGKLKGEDVLMAINAQPILDSDDVYLNIGTYLAGTKIKLHVRRGNGKEHIVDVTLAKLHVPGKSIASAAVARPYFRGLRVDWSSILVQQEPRYLAIPAGVLISDVQAGSAADRANLKSGDVITHVNQAPVPTPSAFYQSVANARGAIELTLYNSPPTRVMLK
jgi:S1-C subfamily serine protease